jgi:rhamnosyltransferase
MSKIAVLMATHNGARWLNEQLQSIIHQQGVDVALYVSDDMSSDETLNIIQLASHTYPQITLLPGKRHFGSAAQNFFRLIKEVDLDQFAYIALSDQDDVWLPEKLKRALDIMKTHNIDAYSSNITAFWPDGKTQMIDKAQPQRNYDFMFESAGPGCTFVLSKAFAKTLKDVLIKQEQLLSEVALHDWFIYAFARSNGFKWFIDPTSSLMYRQHANNVVGANTGLKAFNARLQKLSQGWYSTQIRNIARILGYADAEPIKRMRRLKLSDRGYLALNAHQFRRRPRDRVAFMLYILFFSKKT